MHRIAFQRLLATVNINANRSKGEVLSSAIALTDQLYEQSYTLKEEHRILWICVGSLLAAQFIF